MFREFGSDGNPGLLHSAFNQAPKGDITRKVKLRNVFCEGVGAKLY